MPLYEITLTASKVVKFHAPNRIDAEQRALAAVTELSEVEVTDSGETEDGTFYDYLPDRIRAIVDKAEAGEEMEVLGVGQTANRVFDDGEWAVYVERVGPADGYEGPPVTVQFYDGTKWSDFDPDEHLENEDQDEAERICANEEGLYDIARSGSSDDLEEAFMAYVEATDADVDVTNIDFVKLRAYVAGDEDDDDDND